MNVIVVQLGTDYTEADLQAIASDPDCTHLIYLESYNDLRDLSYLLERQICESKCHMM